MSGYSNVGNRGVYEAGDQRNAPESERDTHERFNEGVENSHLSLDSSKRNHVQIPCQTLTRLQRMSDQLPTDWRPRRFVDTINRY
jgi:hypothetical protein